MFENVLLGLLVIAVVVEGFALLAVMRQVGTVLKHVRPPRPGAQFGGPTPGTELDLAQVAAQPAIVVFVSPNCPSCKGLEPALQPVARNYDLELVTVLVGGSARQREAYQAEAAYPTRLDLPDLYDDWEIPGTPYAVGIGSDGCVVESGIVNSLDQLEALAEHVLNPPLPADELSDLEVEALLGSPVASHGGSRHAN